MNVAGLSYLGVPVEFRAIVGSTNDDVLLRAAGGAPEGLVIATDEQTAGRGRQGRSWWDAPGESLLFSLLLRPGIPLARFPLLGIAMACAVAEAGGAVTGASLGVKWPNDVLWEGRKLCGILAEARPGPASESPQGSRGHVLVIGTGVNVNQRVEELPEELRDRATSLRAAGGGRALAREELLSAVLARFESYRATACDQGVDALYRRVRPFLPAPGSPIVVNTADRRVEGTVDDVLETGALVVKDASGARFPVVAGEIPLGAGERA